MPRARSRERLGWFAIFVAVATAVAAEEPSQWLARMNQALTTRNYDGTFTHWHGGKVEMLRIIHRVQDGAVQMSAGLMYDRAKEHLVPADLAIIRLRRLFADSIRLIEAGHDPVGIGVDYDSTQVTAVSTIIDADQDWRALVPGHLGSTEAAR